MKSTDIRHLIARKKKNLRKKVIETMRNDCETIEKLCKFKIESSSYSEQTLAVAIFLKRVHNSLHKQIPIEMEKKTTVSLSSTIHRHRNLLHKSWLHQSSSITRVESVFNTRKTQCNSEIIAVNSQLCIKVNKSALQTRKYNPIMSFDTTIIINNLYKFSLVVHSFKKKKKFQ